MPDQNRLDDFDEVKTQVEAGDSRRYAKRGGCLDRTVVAEQSPQLARYRAASEAWEAVKGRPGRGGLRGSAISVPGCHGTANHEAASDHAVREADRAYHAEVRRLAAERLLDLAQQETRSRSRAPIVEYAPGVL
jgi:hypothetical protein